MQPKRALALVLQEKARRKSLNRIVDYKPYSKQKEFHTAGKSFRERCLMAGNQLGKTYSAAAEVAYHLTGLYPDWWDGYRFDRPTNWLAGSESGELTKKGIQRLLFGRDIKNALGSGMIPGNEILCYTPGRGVPELIDAAKIRHVSGGVSTISLKSYEQGRGKWQADTVDGVWYDEEPPLDIYTEGLTRTNVTLGLVILTETPLKGMSDTVMRYIGETKAPGTCVITMTIDDAEHYTPEQRAAIIASYPAHEKEARTKGTPMLGSGRIFPISEESITVAPFEIPRHWAQIGGLDFGYDHPFGAVKLAWDRDSDIIYVTKGYRIREQGPLVHAGALKPWGKWLPWAWPHDGLQHDKGSCEQLAKHYEEQGLAMLPERATFEDGGNGVEAGITEMLERMKTGRLKVFNTEAEWLEEFRLYHRKDGKIIKERDDLLSATRYGIMMKRFALTKAEGDYSDKIIYRNSGIV
jgi:phage terminase large subunit-like protein